MVLAPRDLLHSGLERSVGRGAYHLGEALAHVDGVVEHARGVVDGLLGLDGRVGDDVGDLLGAVELAHVLDDLEAPLIVEVHVDIGHLGALGREESLEHEVVRERVEGRDVHRVGNEGAGGRPTAGAHADAVLLGPAHVLLHDEEVGGEALVADDLVLVLEALLDVDAVNRDVLPVLAERLARPSSHSRRNWLSWVSPSSSSGEARQDESVELDVGLLGQLEGVVAGLGAPGNSSRISSSVFM